MNQVIILYTPTKKKKKKKIKNLKKKKKKVEKKKKKEKKEKKKNHLWLHMKELEQTSQSKIAANKWCAQTLSQAGSFLIGSISDGPDLVHT